MLFHAVTAMKRGLGRLADCVRQQRSTCHKWWRMRLCSGRFSGSCCSHVHRLHFPRRCFRAFLVTMFPRASRRDNPEFQQWSSARLPAPRMKAAKHMHSACRNRYATSIRGFLWADRLAAARWAYTARGYRLSRREALFRHSRQAAFRPRQFMYEVPIEPCTMASLTGTGLSSRLAKNGVMGKL